MNEIILLTAPVTCPECAHETIGRWTAGQRTAGQQCPGGHAFTATWPGWGFEPETVVVTA